MGALTRLQMCSRCILQPKPTGQYLFSLLSLNMFFLLSFFFIFHDNILFPLIAFCFLNSSASQFYTTLRLWNLYCYKKTLKNSLKSTLYTCKQSPMMAYERFKSVRDNFGKFIHQFQSETKTLIWKLARIFLKLYRQNVSLSFHQTCLNESLLPNYKHTHTHTHIYMCVCVCVCVCVAFF